MLLWSRHDIMEWMVSFGIAHISLSVLLFALSFLMLVILPMLATCSLSYACLRVPHCFVIAYTHHVTFRDPYMSPMLRAWNHTK